MENSNHIIGNPTRDLPACSAVPQPTALTCALYSYLHLIKSSPNSPTHANTFLIKVAYLQHLCEPLSGTNILVRRHFELHM
jgi:hypothetical protein